LGDLGIKREVDVKSDLKKWDLDVDLIHLAQYRGQWSALAKHDNEHLDSIKRMKFLSR
jgi:hypothetical protein